MPRGRAFALCLVLLGSTLAACSREAGPVDVAWDRTRCAECGMLVSDPAFAAQRHLEAGEVLHYDDPGCLLVSLEPRDLPGTADADALYFHHREEDRWLDPAEARFVETKDSPMGYRIGAVSRDEAPDALSLPQARDVALARDRARSAP